MVFQQSYPLSVLEPWKLIPFPLDIILNSWVLPKVSFFCLENQLANRCFLCKIEVELMAFPWFVTHKMVNTIDMLQLRRPFKALSLDWCIICRSREMINLLLLHCLITLGFWRRIFSQAGMVWVKLDTIHDMMVISLKCFENSIRDKTLWRIVCLSLLWIVWRERNATIFEETWKTLEMM